MTTIKEKINKILGFGSYYSNLDLKYFAVGGFWNAFGQFTNGLISFGLIIAFANYLPKETYGLYRYILSLAAFFNIFTLTGMNTAVAQAVASGNDGALKTSVKYQLKWNVLMALAMLSTSAYYFLNNNQTLAFSFLILAVTSPLIAAFNTYGAFLNGKRQFKINNIWSIVSTIVYAGGVFIALLINADVLWLIATYALTTLMVNLFFYIQTLRLFNPSETPSKETLDYGRKLTFIGFMGPIASQIDIIILNHFWGPASLAVYSLAMAIPDRAVPLVKSFVDIGFPKLAMKTPREINSVFWKRIFQGFLIGIIVAAVYILIAPTVFKYLMPKYLDAIFYSQILAIGFVFALPNRYTSSIMSAQKMTRAIFANTLFQNIVRISLYIILGISGGIWGLIWAQVLNSALSLIANILVCKFKLKN